MLNYNQPAHTAPFVVTGVCLMTPGRLHTTQQTRTGRWNTLNAKGHHHHKGDAGGCPLRSACIRAHTQRATQPGARQHWQAVIRCGVRIDATECDQHPRCSSWLRTRAPPQGHPQLVPIALVSTQNRRALLRQTTRMFCVDRLHIGKPCLHCCFDRVERHARKGL